MPDLSPEVRSSGCLLSALPDCRSPSGDCPEDVYKRQLLTQEQGLIHELLVKMKVDTQAMLSDLTFQLANIPKVTGTGREADKRCV